MTSIRGRVLIVGSTGLVALFAGVWLCNIWIVSTTESRAYEELSAVPSRDMALVLGTSGKTPDGRWSNPHFSHRIEAAAALYKAGKVKRLLVSGDNHVRGYDEPTDMRDALVAAGVPADAIVLDYAGFRTLDSVVRARQVFGQTRLTIVSEAFHNYRALFICRHYGIDAVAFNARPVSLRVSTWPAVREWLARVKVVLDLYVLRTGPKFLGEPVKARRAARRRSGKSLSEVLRLICAGVWVPCRSQIQSWSDRRRPGRPRRWRRWAKTCRD